MPFANKPDAADGKLKGDRRKKQAEKGMRLKARHHARQK